MNPEKYNPANCLDLVLVYFDTIGSEKMHRESFWKKMHGENTQNKFFEHGINYPQFKYDEKTTETK